MKPRPSTSSSQPPAPEGTYTYTDPSTSARIYRLLGAPVPFDPEYAFVTSPILSAPLLAAVRLTLALYTLVALIFALVWDATRLHDADSCVLPITPLPNFQLLTSWLKFTGFSPILPNSPISGCVRTSGRRVFHRSRMCAWDRDGADIRCSAGPAPYKPCTRCWPRP